MSEKTELEKWFEILNVPKKIDIEDILTSIIHLKKNNPTASTIILSPKIFSDLQTHTAFISNNCVDATIGKIFGLNTQISYKLSDGEILIK